MLCGNKVYICCRHQYAFYVQLVSSAEGKGTVTRFWLENEKGDNLCNVVEVTQGRGYYPQNTYQSACKKRIFLTAENNNYNSDVYRITGTWKEE